MDLVSLVKEFEGFHRVVRSAQAVSDTAVPYLCPAGYWTIAYGHVCARTHPPVSREQGEVYLHGDLEIARNAVNALIRWPLAPRQVDALTSWTFNLGANRLRGSTMRACINRGELERVPAEMRRWVFAAGVRLGGLVARREAEVVLWRSA